MEGCLCVEVAGALCDSCFHGWTERNGVACDREDRVVVLEDPSEGSDMDVDEVDLSASALPELRSGDLKRSKILD